MTDIQEDEWLLARSTRAWKVCDWTWQEVWEEGNTKEKERWTNRKKKKIVNSWKDNCLKILCWNRHLPPVWERNLMWWSQLHRHVAVPYLCQKEAERWYTCRKCCPLLIERISTPKNDLLLARHLLGSGDRISFGALKKVKDTSGTFQRKWLDFLSLVTQSRLKISKKRRSYWD